MLKTTLAVVAGLAAWVVLITIAGAIMRAGWAGYAAVADSMAFTLPMLVARLAIGAIALVIAASAATRISPHAATTWILGSVLLAGFIPIHINLWNKFPVWYHLTFLLTLIPLSLLGGRVRVNA